MYGAGSLRSYGGSHTEERWTDYYYVFFVAPLLGGEKLRFLRTHVSGADRKTRIVTLNSSLKVPCGWARFRISGRRAAPSLAARRFRLRSRPRQVLLAPGPPSEFGVCVSKVAMARTVVYRAQLTRAVVEERIRCARAGRRRSLRVSTRAVSSERGRNPSHEATRRRSQRCLSIAASGAGDIRRESPISIPCRRPDNCRSAEGLSALPRPEGPYSTAHPADRPPARRQTRSDSGRGAGIAPSTKISTRSRIEVPASTPLRIRARRETRTAQDPRVTRTASTAVLVPQPMRGPRMGFPSAVVKAAGSRTPPTLFHSRLTAVKLSLPAVERVGLTAVPQAASAHHSSPSRTGP